MIDKYNLDNDWVEWDKISDETSQDYAKAVHIRDTFKNEVFDPYVAELDLEIRNDPERFGISKLSEKAIQSTIDKDPAFIEKKLKLINLDRDVNAATGENIRLTRRAKALENLTKLAMRDYYFMDRDIMSDELKEKLRKRKDEDEIDKGLNDPEAVAKMKKPKLKIKKGK